MGNVRVSPQTFTLVDYDAARIRAQVEMVATGAGFGDRPVEIEIDETTPMGRSRLESVDPIRIRVESGAFEDPRHPRALSDAAVAEVVGRHLFKLADSSAPGFGAPDEGDLDIAHQVAWDIYAMGRLVRLGVRDQRQRWLYHFRNRCGFSDDTDASFEALWTGDGLTWPQIEDLVDRAIRGSVPVS